MAPKVSPEYMLARRNEILDAATKVFSEKGFHAATLDDIAETAEISKGSIYIHFDSKEAMIDGLSEIWGRTDDEVFDVAESMPRAIDGVGYVTKTTLARSQRADFGDSIRLGIFVWAEVLVNPAVRKSQSRLGSDWRTRYATLLTKAKEQGDINERYSVESVMSLLGALGRGFFLARGVWGVKQDVPGVEELIDNFISTLK